MHHELPALFLGKLDRNFKESLMDRIWRMRTEAGKFGPAIVVAPR